jgi:hypothetical protein
MSEKTNRKSKRTVRKKHQLENKTRRYADRRIKALPKRSGIGPIDESEWPLREEPLYLTSTKLLLDK